MTPLQFILLAIFFSIFIWIAIANNGPKCSDTQHQVIFYKAICQSCIDSQNGNTYILNKSDGGECDITSCKIISKLNTCI